MVLPPIAVGRPTFIIASIFEDSKSPFFNSLGTDCLNYKLFSAFSNILYQNSKDPANLIIKTRLLCNILSL